MSDKTRGIWERALVALVVFLLATVFVQIASGQSVQYGRVTESTDLLNEPNGVVIEDVPQFAEFVVNGESITENDELWIPVEMVQSGEIGYIDGSIVEYAMQGSDEDVRLYASEGAITCIFTPFLRASRESIRYHYGLRFQRVARSLIPDDEFTLLYQGDVVDDYRIERGNIYLSNLFTGADALSAGFGGTLDWEIWTNWQLLVVVTDEDDCL